MAKKIAKSGLMAKLGAAGRSAVKTHKVDETTYGTGGSLPAGIEDGIAQLTMCKFDIYKKGDNKGEYYFMAMGVVMEPVEHEGLRIQGRQTRIGPEAICDTPQSNARPTLDDHVDWVLNEMRKLGVDTKDMGEDDLEVVAQGLEEAKPFFRFRTWKGKPTEQYPNPRVNEVWEGVTDYTPPDEDTGVVDHTEEAATDTEEPDDKGDDSGSDKELSLEELGRLAEDSQDEEAQADLQEKAAALGIDADEIETWTEVATLIAEKEDGGDNDKEGSEEGEEFVPEKGEVYLYKPKGARKLSECTVTATFEKSQTCNLRRLDDDKTFRAVAWDELVEQE